MSKRLLIKNTNALLTWLPIVLLVGSLLFYVVLEMHARHMQEKQLLLKQNNIWSAFILKPDSFPMTVQGEYELEYSNDSNAYFSNEPRDTTIFIENTKQSLPFQVLSNKYSFNGKFYKLSTYVSSKEIRHLIIKVFITEAIIFILLLLTVIIVNEKSSSFLWKPFFSTINKVKYYDIKRNQRLDLPVSTGTTEFDELNKEINSLVKKVSQAYVQQKHFVENASHEMQTPLAIIRSKLELLINQQGLTEKTALLISDISEANDHLSRMNRTLLLLAKIENNQFPEIETVSISNIIRQIINNYKNYYTNEFPSLIEKINIDIIVKANYSLIEILVSNLLKNAIEHNKKGGFIEIELNNSQLMIKNSGLQPEKETELLFERFSKGSYQSKTTGLGLSLVKQICLLYNYHISYKYENEIHTLAINFSGFS